MAKLYNLARMTTATTGTGTITLGSAVSGYLSFASAGVSNGETVTYSIKDGANSEIGTGVYTASGTTLTRNVTKSTNSDSAINLSGSAEVVITARKEDLLSISETQTANTTLAGPTSGGAAAPSFRALVGADLPTGSTVQLSSQSASSSATIDFTGLDNTYAQYILRFYNVLPATDGTYLYWRIGTGGTPTWQSGATYEYANIILPSVGTITEEPGSTANQIVTGWVGASRGISNGAGSPGITGELTFVRPATSKYPTFSWQLNYYSGNTNKIVTISGAGAYLSSTAFTGVRALMSSGNISSGTFILYGIK